MSPTEAWSRRVRRVGGLIQIAFAAFWLVRGSLYIASDVGIVLAIVLGAIAATAGGYGLRVTAGAAPMPSGPEAKRIGRAVTVATIVQLLASFAVPAVVIAAGHAEWVLPSVVITIGPLLLWLDHRLQVPRYRSVGWALSIGPVVLVATLSGTTLAATTGLAAGALLLCGATAGFHDLAKLRQSSLAKAGLYQPTLPANVLVDSHTPRFRPFFNPVTGEHIKYTAVAEDNDGEFVRFNWRSVPGGVITEHIHPHQEERFAITAGEARFTLNGQVHLVRAGQTVVVPAGVPHSEGNSGSADVEGTVELHPALHTKEWHEALAGLVADGNTTSRGAPRNPLQLGATFWHFRHESRVTSPPIWVQNLMLLPLWVLAKVFGVHSYYDRWDTRI